MTAPRRPPARRSDPSRRIEIDRRPLAIVLLERLRTQLWLALVFAVFAFALGLDPPDGLDEAGWATMCVFGLCVVLWSSSLLPLAVTSLLAMALIPLLGVMPASESYAYFGSKVVFFILGAFMLGAALVTSGLSVRIATVVVGRFGRTPRRLVLAVFLLCAAGATVMSTHAVAVMIFPIVVDIARALKLRPLRSPLGMALFFALAWGCIIGGSLTVLGGGRAPLAIGMLEESTHGASTIAFTEYIGYAAPLVGLMLLSAVWMLTRSYQPEIATTEEALRVLQAKRHEMGKLTPRERTVALVVTATIAAWAFLGDELGIANIAIVAIVALFVFAAITWRETEENVNWGVIVMYGGAICLGGAMEQSGAAEWLAQGVLGAADLSPEVLLILLAIVSAALTEFMSNSAVIAMLMPPALSLATQFGVDPRAVTMAVVLPSNFAFMFPVATPVTAIAWSAGYYTPRQVATAGLRLHVVGLACMVLLILVWWPAVGLLPGG